MAIDADVQVERVIVLAVLFDSDGWPSWGVEHEPLIRPGMPVLIDDDLRFEVGGQKRPTVVVNRWLRELPTRGAPASRTWVIYAGVLRQWLEFVAGRGMDAFGHDLQKVKSNKGAPGVDGCSIADFEKDLKNNLYQVWNRMSSGSYFPPAVRAVEIPKSHGAGTRILVRQPPVVS